MIPKFSVKKPFTVFVAVAIVIIFGGVSLYRMTPELFPNINTPYVMVMTADPGASAEEAETEITRPLEQQLATLPNMKEITSLSYDNYSLVNLEFTDDVNMDSISVDIRDKLEQIRDQLPEGAGTPVVMKINIDMMPVVVAAVSQKNKSAEQVSSLTRDELLSTLEGTEGVASVSTMGMIDDGLKVVLSQDGIDALNARVERAINAQIDEGKDKVREGISSAKSGKNKISDGQDQVNDGQSNASTQLLDKKKELIKKKAALQVQKEEVEKQLERLPQLQALATGIEGLSDSDDPRVMAEVERQLKEMGFNSVEELNAAIKQLEQLDTSQIDAGNRGRACRHRDTGKQSQLLSWRNLFRPFLCRQRP